MPAFNSQPTVIVINEYNIAIEAIDHIHRAASLIDPIRITECGNEPFDISEREVKEFVKEVHEQHSKIRSLNGVTRVKINSLSEHDLLETTRKLKHRQLWENQYPHKLLKQLEDIANSIVELADQVPVDRPESSDVAKPANTVKLLPLNTIIEMAKSDLNLVRSETWFRDKLKVAQHPESIPIGKTRMKVYDLEKSRELLLAYLHQ